MEDESSFFVIIADLRVPSTRNVQQLARARLFAASLASEISKFSQTVRAPLELLCVALGENARGNRTVRLDLPPSGSSSSSSFKKGAVGDEVNRGRES